MSGHHLIKRGELVFHFKAYMAKTKGEPYLVKDWVGKDGTQVKREKEKPLSLVGFYAYMGWTGICRNTKEYFMNREGLYSDYQDEVELIKDVIAADQQEGSMAGVYNPAIVARIQQLAETVITNNNVKILNIDPLADDPSNNGTS